MIQRILLGSIVVVAMAWAVPCEAQSLNGDWAVSTGTSDGQAVPTIALNSMKLTINSTSFSAVSGNLTSSGTLGADSLSSPARLVFTIDQGADSGNKIFAIYKFENGGLTITFSKDENFPSGFDSTADNKYVQLVYKAGTGNSTAATPPPNQTNTGQDGASSSFK